MDRTSKSNLRTLLRGHTKRISDVSFFTSANPSSNQTDVVGTVSGREIAVVVGEEGEEKEIVESGEEDKANVLIWRIYKREHELFGEKLLEIRLKDAIRIVWHPFNPNQFVLLHNCRSGNVDAKNGNEDHGGNEVDKLEYHIVATFIVTTRLKTIKHETENHAVCTCTKRDEIDDKLSTLSGGSFDTNGTLKLICFGPLNQVGIHDLCWSNQDTRHVLTAHKDGNVKLWDVNDVVYLDVRTGEEVDEGELETLRNQQSELIVESAKCIMTFNVNTNNTAEKGRNQEVQRCIFLPSEQSNASTITSPFITVTKRGTSVSLWSPFTSTSSPPSIIRTFELGGCSPNTEYSVSLCPIPNSMMKNSLSESDSLVCVPSMYVLFANKSDGDIYALHLKNATASAGSPVSVPTVNGGFDYLVPFRATQPIYSWTAMVLNDDNDQESEEGWKIDLFCVQSKSVQSLTLTSKMLSPPWTSAKSQSEALGDNDELPNGVTVEKFTADNTIVGSSNDDDDDDEEDIDFEEEEYDVEDDNNDVEDDNNEIEYDEYDDEEYDVEEDDDAVVDDEEEMGDTEKVVEEKPMFVNVPPPPMPNVLSGNADNSNPSSFANWLGNLAGVSVQQSSTTKKEEVKAENAVPPTPQLTPLTSQPNIDLDLSNIPLPTVPDVEFQEKLQEKTEAEDVGTKIKTMLEKPKATQRYLSPIEMLASTGKQLSGPEEIKLVATKTFDATTDGGKVPSMSKSEKKEPKKKSQKSKTSQQLPFPCKDGKIAILKREDTTTPKLPAGVVEPTTYAAGPPASSVGITKMEVEEIVRKAVSSHFQKQENVITAEIQKAVRYEVQSGLVPTLNKTVSQTLDQTVSKTMKSTVTKSVKESTKINTSELANEIARKLEDPLTESFYKSMRDIMIPAFESGTRQMFEQISTSVEKGLDVKNQNHDDMQKAMNEMTKRMDAMAKTMEVLIQGVAKMSVGTQKSAVAPQNTLPPHVDKVELLKGKIRELLAAKDYSKAFTTALTASNADLAVWACKFSDLSIVLESETPKLTQPIMLCLMQQLGCDFSKQKDEDLPVKLSWLQSLSLTLDPCDESIKKHIMDVCQNLIKNLQAKMAEPNVIYRREMQMLTQVVRGIGRS